MSELLTAVLGWEHGVGLLIVQNIALIICAEVGRR